MRQCIKFIYFGMTLYMFRTVFPSIISSSRLYIQQQAFVKQILLYVQSWTADDGRKDRLKHVDCHSKIKLIWYIGASGWFYYRNDLNMLMKNNNDMWLNIFINVCLSVHHVSVWQSVTCFRYFCIENPLHTFTVSVVRLVFSLSCLMLPHSAVHFL